MAKLQDRVACIIFCKHNNLLYIPLVKYIFKDVFDIPRGGVEPTDKNFKTALVRELDEELSLNLANNKFYKVSQYEEWHRSSRNNVMLHYVIHSFVTSVVELVPLKPKDTKEIKFAQWFEYTNAIQKLYECKNIPPIKQIFLAHLVALRYKLF